MKIYAVGDIHGNYEALRLALDGLRHKPKGKIIFLGDYIDRGQQSYEVVETAIRLQSQGVLFLRGNHEEMLLLCKWDKDCDLWLFNGGYDTLMSYKRSTGKAMVPDHHFKFMSRLPLYFQTKNYIFVHAGLVPGIPFAQNKKDDMLWTRSEFVKSKYDWGKRVVFGHTIQWNGPLVEPNKIGIDTGCYRTGVLTVAELDDDDPSFIEFHTFKEW